MDTVEPVLLPVEQPLAYTTEPLTEMAATATVETSSVQAEPVKTSTTKKVVSTVLTALGAGALIGI